MKNLFLTFLIVQFLNVQIQTAFATEGVSQFHAAEAGAPIAALQARVSERLEGLGERVQRRLAYGLFKISIKLRNRVAGMSEETFQERMKGAEVSETEPTLEDQEMAAEINQLEELGAWSSELESLDSSRLGKNALTSVSQSELLRGADALLIHLGAKLGSENRLEKISYRQFRESFYREAKRVTLKVILSLVVLVLGLSIITLAFVYFLATALSGVGTSSAWFYVVLFGTLIGMFFGIRAIIRASVEPRGGRAFESGQEVPLAEFA